MKIVIDYVFNAVGEQMSVTFIDTDDLKCVIDPSDSNKTLSSIEHIARLNSNPAIRDQAGWHVSAQHPGEPAPMTRWERLVVHTNSPDGHPALKALNLK